MEIMGQELDLAFQELGIKATKTHETPKKDYFSSYQVWELSDSQFEELEQVSDSQWQDNYGWWRTGGCIYEGDASVEYLVNDQTMMGYTPNAVFADEEDEDGESFFETVFKDYSQWMSQSMNLTKDTNMVIFATSLAKDNGMKLSEFMKKYQG